MSTPYGVRERPDIRLVVLAGTAEVAANVADFLNFVGFEIIPWTDQTAEFLRLAHGADGALRGPDDGSETFAWQMVLARGLNLPIDSSLGWTGRTMDQGRHARPEPAWSPRFLSGRTPQNQPAGQASDASLSARDEDILARRLAGQTLEEIGAVHGITRERVRQLASRFAPRGSVRDRQIGAAHRIRRCAEAVSDAESYVSAQAACRRRGLEIDDVLGAHPEISDRVDALRSEYLRDLTRPDHHSVERHDDEEILDAIRDLARRNGLQSLSVGAYRKHRGDSDPSTALIHKRFGWNRAMELAGLEVNAAHDAENWGAGTRRWDARDCVRAAADFARERGIDATHADYEVWAQENDRPSSGTLRDALGGWKASRRFALAEIVRTDDQVLVDGQWWSASLIPDEFVSAAWESEEPGEAV